MTPLLNIDFKFNTFALLTELDRYKDKIGPYVDKRYGEIDNFKILRGSTDLKVMTKECERFLLHYGFDLKDGEPRYYILKADTVLPTHTDKDTLCSVNHLLDGAAPITFDGDAQYMYTTALVDISKPHGVDNRGQPDRLLFKISFFNHTFEEVYSKIVNR